MGGVVRLVVFLTVGLACFLLGHYVICYDSSLASKNHLDRCNPAPRGDLLQPDGTNRLERRARHLCEINFVGVDLGCGDSIRKCVFP